MIGANSEFVHTSKSLFWPDVSGQPGPTAIRVNGYRSTKTDGDESNHDRVCWHQ